MNKVALVVEDELLIRSFLSNVLRTMDFEVLEADNEDEAWELYEKRKEDITFIFTDVNLRLGNGLNLYNRIRSVNTETPVVVSSAMADYDISVVDRDQRCRFIPKPFSYHKIVDTIHEYMRNPSFV